MKELSIEEKAKRYDEAIEIAGKIHNEHKAQPFDVMLKVFPELKESEDERIRGNIIATIHLYYGEPLEDEAKEMIAWLEKRGEQKDILEDAILDSNKDGLIADTIRYKREKRGEQKPADKVEPKFHEGEWIIHHGTENIYQVTAIVDNQYQLKYGDNYTTQYCEDVDRCARLWDIAKDAKDGDLIYVSTEKKGIQAIFHEYKNGTIFFHCYLCRDFVQGGYMPIGSVELVYPLQKVHYNRFFEKMHEAGYEWDADKKELKKIEQKPAETEKGAKGNDRENPNSAWSEEDEIALGNALWCCKQAASIAKDENDMGNIWYAENWLKSIKDRVQPQPKQEWSKEDNAMLIEIEDILTGRGHSFYDKEINWLKSIRPQNTWKPSDEQLTSLAWTIEYGNTSQTETLKKLLEQLKAL